MLRRGSIFLASSIFIFISCFTTASYADNLPDFTKLVDSAAPAVVNISTTRKPKNTQNPARMLEEFEGTPFYDMFKHFFNNADPHQFGEKDLRSLGSGFIYKKDGHIITNFHVIDGADEVVVRLNNREEHIAKVVGSDKNSDIAVLKIDAKNLPTLDIADSDELKVGAWVVAIGSPFGFDHSVTAGIVSAVNRNFGDERYVPFIQSDVAINPGNSGGPLLNLKGDVVGVNSRIVTRSGQYGGLSFSIPSDVVKSVVKQLEKHGKVMRGWLGLYFQELNSELAKSFGLKKPRGALVAKVLPDSPAEKAGLQQGDVIVEFNDKNIERAGDLPPLVGQLKPGTKVSLEVIRDRKDKKLNLVVGTLPDEKDKADEEKAEHSIKNNLSMTLRDMRPAEKTKLGAEVSGLVVEEIESGPAMHVGIRKGDVIISVNHVKMKSVADYKKVIKGLKKGDIVPVLMFRPGAGQRYVALKL